ncbi:hypothetical protein QWZ13_01710 [Reinekea marina]|nr:hypothetical protein [Reinekea marina]MDN3647621.1 hypothetical protein [Reinekea marina]
MGIYGPFYNGLFFGCQSSQGPNTAKLNRLRPLTRLVSATIED